MGDLATPTPKHHWAKPLGRPTVKEMPKKPAEDAVVVSVVDDDESVRDSLPDLLRSFGFKARAFASGEAFLASDRIDATQCLVLDIAMPGMSGPEMYAELTRLGRKMPVIFITAHGNPCLCEQLLQQGAVACLAKPFDPEVLVAAVRRATSEN
jgi:FixJ family two-component response regulator